MPIAKGQPWGEPVDAVPEGAVAVRSDAEARRVLEAALAGGRAYPVLHLLGGDLWRTLGGTGPVRFTVDVGEAALDGGKPLLFVAHCVARTRLWTRAFVAMNAQWLGDWNLGPRAHPGDGRLDLYDARLPPNQLLAVRARLHHGAHLPHPGIAERRAVSGGAEFDRALPVRLDGTVVGTARSLVVRVDVDALVVVT